MRVLAGRRGIEFSIRGSYAHAGLLGGTISGAGCVGRGGGGVTVGLSAGSRGSDIDGGEEEMACSEGEEHYWEGVEFVLLFVVLMSNVQYRENGKWMKYTFAEK